MPSPEAAGLRIDETVYTLATESKIRSPSHTKGSKQNHRPSSSRPALNTTPPDHDHTHHHLEKNKRTRTAPNTRRVTHHKPQALLPFAARSRTQIGHDLDHRTTCKSVVDPFLHQSRNHTFSPNAQSVSPPKSRPCLPLPRRRLYSQSKSIATSLILKARHKIPRVDLLATGRDLTGDDCIS